MLVIKADLAQQACAAAHRCAASLTWLGSQLWGPVACTCGSLALATAHVAVCWLATAFPAARVHSSAELLLSWAPLPVQPPQRSREEQGAAHTGSGVHCPALLCMTGLLLHPPPSASAAERSSWRHTPQSSTCTASWCCCATGACARTQASSRWVLPALRFHVQQTGSVCSQCSRPAACLPCLLLGWDK